METKAKIRVLLTSEEAILLIIQGAIEAANKMGNGFVPKKLEPGFIEALDAIGLVKILGETELTTKSAAPIKKGPTDDSLN